MPLLNPALFPEPHSRFNLRKENFRLLVAGGRAQAGANLMPVASTSLGTLGCTLLPQGETTPLPAAAFANAFNAHAAAAATNGDGGAGLFGGRADY